MAIDDGMAFVLWKNSLAVLYPINGIDDVALC